MQSVPNPNKAVSLNIAHTRLCEKVCQRFAAGQWFSSSTLVSSTNKTDRYDITEILLKVALNTITLYPHQFYKIKCIT
jgi:hypothetical protein